MNKKVLWFACTCVLVGTVSYFFMLFLLTEDTENLPPPVAAKPMDEQTTPIDTPVAAANEPKIQPYTKMIYQYYYPDDNITKEQEDVPPYYLLDLTMDDVSKMYEDWKVLAFSDSEVIMRRNMSGKSDERYVVSQKDGYVAVFYEEAQNGISLHEVTDTPISALPKEEQDRLRDGISVYGNDNLCRILADYGS